MSKYVIDTTYSLQLAIAVTDYKDNYKDNYNCIFREMNRVKETMVISRPLGALPVMVIDAKTVIRWSVIQKGDGCRFRKKRWKKRSKRREKNGISGKR